MDQKKLHILSLLAALTAAGQWEPSEIHVVSVTSRA